MALPEFTKTMVESRLTAYCKKAVPPQFQDEMKMGFSFRGNSVTVFEERLFPFHTREWTKLTIAQFQMDATTAERTLYWADRNNKRLHYPDLPLTKDFDKVLHMIDSDTHECFWG